MAEAVPDYSGEVEPAGEGQIAKLNKLVLEMAQVVVREEELEEELKKVKDERRQYEENLIPELMSELGMEALTTKGGLKVEMKEVIRASLPKDPIRRLQAFRYLQETGNDGLIKHEFRINFGRDSQEWVDRLQKILEENNVKEHGVVEQDHTIHNQTLVAFLRKELEAGRDVPLESFGAFTQRFAKIKRK